MPISLSLSGRVALITGGSRGIGAATVRIFAAADARVVFNFRKAKAEAEKLARECGGKKCIALPRDFTGTGTARELIQATVQQFGPPHILVAQHRGLAPPGRAVDQMSEAQRHNTVAG